MSEMRVNIEAMKNAVSRIKNNIKIFETKIKEYERLGMRVNALQWKDKSKDDYFTFFRTNLHLLKKSIEFYKESMVYLENAMAAYEEADKKAANIIEKGGSR